MNATELESALQRVEQVAHAASSREKMEEALQRLDDIETRAEQLGVDLGVRPSSARDWLKTRLAAD